MIDQSQVNNQIKRQDCLESENFITNPKYFNYWVFHKEQDEYFEEVLFKKKQIIKQLDILESVARGLSQLHDQGLFYSQYFNPTLEIASLLINEKHDHYVLISNDMLKPSDSILQLQQGIKRDNKKYLEIMKLLLDDQEFNSKQQYKLISTLLQNFYYLKKNVQNLYRIEEVLDIFQLYRDKLKQPIFYEKAAIIELSRHITAHIVQIQRQEMKKKDEQWLKKE